MSHRRDFSTDAVHVIPTNDPPPEYQFPDPVSALSTDETESPCKKTRGSPSSSSSSEIGKAFFKTKLCCNFRAGNCPYAASTCHYAHSVEDLRRPPSSRQETRGEFKVPGESGRPPYNKGRHCKKFYSGEGCPYGESCTFLHDEVSRNRESFAISLGHRGGYGAGGDGGSVVVSPNWKTRICNKWETSGFCPFGTNCRFAHGASELHRFGGGLVEEEEEESKIRTSSTLDTVTRLVSPGVPSQRASNAVTSRPNGVRVLRKWKGPDRISRVYGDWIDDIE